MTLTSMTKDQLIALANHLQKQAIEKSAHAVKVLAALDNNEDVDLKGLIRSNVALLDAAATNQLLLAYTIKLLLES